MTYSFLDVLAAIVGPGIIANLGAGAGVAEEGIDITPNEDKNIMNVGADGQVQHNLLASDAGTVKLRFLKTSPVNALLMVAYEFQTSSSRLWGSNVITVSNPVTGDVITIQQCAFKKVPEIKYAKEGGMIEWEFDSGKINRVLGIATVVG